MNLYSRLKYSFYIIFHPFNGFYDLKHEKRGNMSSASILVGLLILSYVLRRYLTNFIFNKTNINDINILTEIGGILIPILLWCVANWCITTLMDGEGTLKDVYITTAYALVPIILISLPLIVISNIVIIEESQFYFFFDSFSIIWAGILLFFGILTVHQYTVSKTIITFIMAIIGMIAMLFLGLLFFTLLQQMINFAYLIFQELSIRS